MAVQKNQIVELHITGMTAEGNGVGRTDDGMAVFVAKTAVGDHIRCRIARVEKRFAYGIVEELLSPSPDRCEDVGCAVYGKCGGCVYRHVSYEAELRYKQQRVEDAFTRLAGLSPAFHPILGSPAVSGYRNKAQYPVTGDANAPIIGFFAPRSHRVIAQRRCALQPSVFGEILDAVAEWMTASGAQPYDEVTKTGLVRHIYLREASKTNQIMVCLVCTGGKLPAVPMLIDTLNK